MIIKFPKKLFQNIQGLAKNNHPHEIILLLRGEKVDNNLIIQDFLLPPMGVGGVGFASFPAHMLPIDFSIIGTLHSHPSGQLQPSMKDLHSMYGRIMVIIGPPYLINSIAAYKKSGERIDIKII
jgi:proteasome lid subunit RPN8/RPN11